MKEHWKSRKEGAGKQSNLDEHNEWTGGRLNNKTKQTNELIVTGINRLIEKREKGKKKH